MLADDCSLVYDGGTTLTKLEKRIGTLSLLIKRYAIRNISETARYQIHIAVSKATRRESCGIMNFFSCPFGILSLC